MPRFYGKYRGKVLANFDTKGLGRLLVNVPKVMGAGQDWAWPAAVFAGQQSGIYAVPPPQANVWVEFEEGDAKKPIWSGGFWDKGMVPRNAVDPSPPVAHILMQTTLQNQIHICDGPAAPLTTFGIVLRSGASTIVIGPEGVTINAPKITINGVTNINNGALLITI